jgi:hypothetical protein
MGASPSLSPAHEGPRNEVYDEAFRLSKKIRNHWFAQASTIRSIQQPVVSGFE